MAGRTSSCRSAVPSQALHPYPHSPAVSLYPRVSLITRTPTAASTTLSASSFDTALLSTLRALPGQAGLHCPEILSVILHRLPGWAHGSGFQHPPGSYPSSCSRSTILSRLHQENRGQPLRTCWPLLPLPPSSPSPPISGVGTPPPTTHAPICALIVIPYRPLTHKIQRRASTSQTCSEGCGTTYIKHLEQ